MNKEWPTRSLQSPPLAQGTPSLEELRERVKQHNIRALPVNPLVNDLWAEVAALSAQVVELQKDAERWRLLQAAVHANPLPETPEAIEAWAKALSADTANAND